MKEAVLKDILVSEPGGLLAQPKEERKKKKAEYTEVSFKISSLAIWKIEQGWFDLSYWDVSTRTRNKLRSFCETFSFIEGPVYFTNTVRKVYI